MKFSLAEQTKIIEAITPSTGKAAATGDYISLAGAPRIAVVCHINQANAAAVALTIEQAKDASGTESKAITEKVPIWANEDAAASEYMERKEDAVSYTTDAQLKKKIVVFQVDTDVLDKENGFLYICVKAALSNEANILSALYIIGDLRYGAAEGPELTV